MESIVERDWGRVLYSCKFPSCKSVAYRKNRIKRFFTFPKDQERQQLWRKICNIEPHVRCENFRVCEDHFVGSDFMGSRVLSHHAVPKSFINDCFSEEHSSGSAVEGISEAQTTTELETFVGDEDLNGLSATSLSSKMMETTNSEPSLKTDYALDMNRPKRMKFTCKFPNCNNKYYQGAKNKHFYCFPKGEIQKKWREVCNIADSVNCSYFKICEDHFLDKDFMNGSKERRIFHSVPTRPAMNQNEGNPEPELSCASVEVPFSDEVEPPEQPEIVKENSQRSKGPKKHIKSFLDILLKDMDSSIQKPFFKSLKYKQDDDSCEICRICLRSLSKDDTIPLYGEDLGIWKTKILHMVKKILPRLDLKVFTHTVICIQCLESVTCSYRLRKKWLETDRLLQKMFQTKKQKFDDNRDLLIVNEATEDLEENVSSVDFDHCYYTKNEILKVEEIGNNLKDLLTSPPEQSVSEYHIHLREYIPGVNSGNADPLNVSNSGEARKSWWDLEPQWEIPLIRPKRVSKEDGNTGKHWWGFGPYVCEICGGFFTKLKRFRMHLWSHKRKRVAVKKEKEIMCELCGQMFSTVSRLKLHEQKHVQFKCNICKKLFKHRFLLNQHIKIVHLNLRNYWQCHICGRRLASSAGLKLHLDSHNPIKKYRCQICDKQFARLVYLRKHIRVHVTTNLVNCEICGKSFKYETSLKRHVNVCHLNKGSYVCQFCDKSYWKNCALKRHKLMVHGFTENRGD